MVDPRGEVVRTFSSDSAAAEEADGEQISGAAGLNRIAWTLHYPGPELPEGAVVWGYSDGVKAPPGTYTVRMTVGETMEERAFELLPDPRIPEVTASSYEEQFRVAVLARDSINSITRAIEDLAAIRAQVEEVMARAQAADQAEALQTLADTLAEKSTGVTEDLMQTRNRSNQDPIRFPPRSGQPVAGALRARHRLGRVHRGRRRRGSASRDDGAARGSAGSVGRGAHALPRPPGERTAAVQRGGGTAGAAGSGVAAAGEDCELRQLEGTACVDS